MSSVLKLRRDAVGSCSLNDLLSSVHSGNKQATISKPDSTASFLHGYPHCRRLQERHGSLRNSATILIRSFR